MSLRRLRRFGRKAKPVQPSLLDLPQEILGSILALIPMEDHVACMQTCRLMLQIGNEEWVWRQRYRCEFGLDTVPSIGSWKDRYTHKYQYWALRAPRCRSLSDAHEGGYRGPICDVDYDGRSIVVFAWSYGTVCVSNLGTKTRRITEILTPIYACRLSLRRDRIYLGANCGVCIVLCCRTLRTLSRIVVGKHDESIIRILETPHGVLFAGSSGTIATVRRDGSGNDGRVVTFENAHSAAINGLVYSSKHDIIATLSCDGRVIIWRWSDSRGRLICCRKYTLKSENSDMSCLSVYEDAFIVGGKADGTIQIYDLTDGRLVGELSGHGRQVRTMHIDGKYLASGAYDGTVRLWDLSSTRHLQEIVTNSAKSHWILSACLKRRKLIYGAGSECNLAEFD